MRGQLGLLCRWVSVASGFASMCAAQTQFGPELLAVPAGPQRVAVGNLVGDAHNDIVCTSATGSIAIHRGIGGGGFLGPIVLPALQFQGFADLELADLDGDGDLDIVALGDALNPSIVVLKNLGNQVFAPPVVTAAGIYAYGIATGDIDGDLRPDVVVCNAGAADTVRVYLNAGTGSLLAPQVLSLGSGAGPNDVALADVDNDGDLDIVAANWASSLAVLFNQGAAGFSLPVLHPTPGANTRLVLGDWDNDGFRDAAVGDTSARVVVLRNGGAGGFVSPVVVDTIATESHGIASGDLDGDGRLDLAATDHHGQVNVMLGLGSGAFAPATRVFAAARFGLALGDLDGDGRLDLGVARDQQDQIGLLLGDGHGGFGRTLLGLGSSLVAFQLADMNGDGRPDIVGADGNAGFIRVRLALAGGGFGPGTGFASGSASKTLSIARVNADPFLDVVVVGTDDGVRTLFGDGLGGLSAPTAPLQFNGPQQMVAGDVDGDGLADLVVSFAYLFQGLYLIEGTTLSLGDGQGGFTFNQSSMHAAHSLLLADFDADGIDEVVRSESSGVRLWEHASGGGFTDTNVVNAGLQSLAAGDVDGDGHLDLLGALSTAGVELMTGDGAGNFAPMVLAAAGHPDGLVVGDFNGDGLSDAFASSSAGLQCLQSRGTVYLVDRGSIVEATSLPRGMAFADIDGDQRPELLVGSGSPSGIVIVTNRGPYNSAVIYCTPKTTSNGCVPVMGSSGTPSVTAASGFTLTCTHAINHKRGLLIYSVAGRAVTPFQGGTLCLHAPILRSPALDSHGNPPPDDCSGVYSVDFNAFAHGLGGGHPAPGLMVVGTAVTAQWWGRDPLSTLPGQSMLSNAIDFVMGP